MRKIIAVIFSMTMFSGVLFADIAILPAETPNSAPTVTFTRPKLGSDQRAILVFKAYLNGGGGFAPYLKVTVDGKALDNTMPNGSRRCINRGELLTANIGGKTTSQPWWGNRGTEPYLVIYFSDNGKNFSSAVTSDVKEGMVYKIDITDCVIASKSKDIEAVFTSFFTSDILKEVPRCKGMVISNLGLEVITDKKLETSSSSRKDKIAIADSPDLKVTYNGQPLIVAEKITGVEIAGQYQKKVEPDGAITYNLSGSSPKLDYRREVTLHPDGVVELSCRANYLESDPNKVLYTFSVPVSLFTGTQYRLRSGKWGPREDKVGKFADILPDGDIFKDIIKDNSLRFLALKKDGVDLVMDFNPLGALSVGTQYPLAGEPLAIIKAFKRGDFVDFEVEKRPLPDVFSGKVLIYAGEYDFSQRHEHINFHYSLGDSKVFPKFYSFTPVNSNGQNDVVDLRDFHPATGAGWIAKPKDLTVYSTPDKNLFTQGVRATKGGKGTLQLRTSQPGIYVLSLSFGQAGETSNVAKVKVNGETVATNLITEADIMRQLFVNIYLADKEKDIIIDIDGDKPWSLSNIILQTYKYSNEDFSIRRNFWVNQSLPSIFPNGINKTTLSGLQVRSFTGDPMTISKGKFSGEIVPAGDFNPPIAGKQPKWLTQVAMTGFGFGNSSNGFNYDTPEKINGRLTVLKDEGFNTIIEAGQFWNNSYSPEQRAKHRKVQVLVNSIAHEKGLSVIRHIDVPCVTGVGSGPNLYFNTPGWCKLNVQTEAPSINMYCINNPFFQKYFWDMLEEYARETDVDGFMLDECYFGASQFCGCSYCRSRFTRDTGSVLPLDSNWQYDKRDDKLVKQFSEWRCRVVGDWWVETQKKVTGINPKLIIVAYDNDLDRMDYSRPMSQSLEFTARGTYLPGVEVGCGNIFRNYRNYYFLRKMTAGITDSFERPSWSLNYVYGSFEKIYYAGWLMNAMVEGGIWHRDGFNGGKYLNWPNRMPFDNTENIADIAIFYRADFNSGASSEVRDTDLTKPITMTDGGGISQVLSDSQIPHVFIIDRDLTPERIAQYRVIILPSVCPVRKSEIAALKTFVENGGTLLVSGYDKGSFANVSDITNNGSAEVKIGKGRILTSGKALGMYNYEPQYYNQTTWTFKLDPVKSQKTIDMVRQAADNKFPLQATGLPFGVLVEGYQEKSGKNRAFIHLANLTGFANEVGKPIAKEVPDTVFQALNNDFEFTINGSYARAVASSPDFAGEEALKAVKSGNGRTKVIMSGKLLTAYTLITLYPN